MATNFRYVCLWYVYNKWSTLARTKVVRRKHIIQPKTEQVFDVLDQAVRGRHLLPANSNQLHIAFQEEWENTLQETTDNLVMSMRPRYAAVGQASGGHTPYWLCDIDISKPIAL